MNQWMKHKLERDIRKIIHEEFDEMEKRLELEGLPSVWIVERDFYELNIVPKIVELIEEALQ